MTRGRNLLLWAIYSGSYFVLGSDHFINPPPLSSQTTSPSSYPVFAVGDLLDVSWVTAAGVVDLVINQLNSPVTEIDRTPNSASLTTSSYTWKITTDGSDGGAKFDLTFSNVFNFMLFQTNGTLITGQSAFFNISNTTVNQHGQRIATLTSASTTRLPISSSVSLSSYLSSAQSTLLSSSSLSSTSITSPTATGTSLPKTNDTQQSATISESLSTGAKAGLGIGVGIVAVAAVLGFIMWFKLHRQKQRAQYSLSAPDYDSPSNDISIMGKDAHANWSPPSELPVPAMQKYHRSEMPLTAPQKYLPTELP